MTIRHANGFEAMRPAGFDGVFDWDFLDSAWQRPITRITPMDIDAVVERYGMFLMFETKSPGAPPMSRGQHLALSRLVQLGRGAITVITLQAKCCADVNGWAVWRYDPKAAAEPDGVQRYWKDGNADALLEFCGQWFVYASGVRLPPKFCVDRFSRADLFASLVSNPVERATLYLEELADPERDYVLHRFHNGGK